MKNFQEYISEAKRTKKKKKKRGSRKPRARLSRSPYPYNFFPYFAGYAGGDMSGNTSGDTGGDGGGAGDGGYREFAGPGIGGNGGSGIVIIRIPQACGPRVSVSPGTNTLTNSPAPDGTAKIATFTVSGTLTVA